MSEILVLIAVGLPAVGALLQIVFGPSELAEKTSWRIGLLFSVLSGLSGLIVSLGLLSGVTTEEIKVLSWLGSYGAHYRLGVDGWNSAFVFVGSILFPLTGLLVSKEKFSRRGLIGLILASQASYLGLVFSQDVLLMFLFWVGLGLFGFFMTSLWGKSGREAAADSYFKVAAVGNAILFAVVLIIYFLAEAKTSNIHDLLVPTRQHDRIVSVFGLEYSFRYLIFVGLLAGIGIRLPIWPIQGLWKKVVRQASPEGLIISMAVTLLGGTFLLIRLGMGLFPEFFLDSKMLFGIVGALNLFFAFLLAYRSRSIREMFTYSSMSIVGFVFLSLSSGSAEGVSGAMGIAVFGCLGLALLLYVMRAVEARLVDDRYTDEEGVVVARGLGRQAPGLALAAGVAVSALSFMPGTGGFPGLTLMMAGLYQSHQFLFYFAVLAVFWMAIASFRMFRALFLGTPNQNDSRTIDLSTEERLFMIPVAVVLVVLGLFPKPFTETARPVVDKAVSESAEAIHKVNAS